MPRSREILLPWDSQPQEVSPLAEGGFDIAWVPSTALVVSDASVVPHPFGTAYKLAAGNSVEIKKSTELLTTQGATVLLCGKSRTPSLGGEFGVLSASGGLGVRFGAHVPYTDGTVYFDFGGATTGTTRVLVSGLTFSENDVFIFSTGQRGMEIWQNGILRASNSANPTRTNDTNPWGLGAHATSPAGTKDSVWWLAAYASRQLPSSQIEEYGRQPFGIFAPQTIWVPVSAGGGGSTSLTVADAAQAHTIDNVVLTSSTALVVQDMAHAHVLDAATLSTGTTLTVADSLHAHALDNVTLSTTGAISLTVADLLHSHALDAVVLTSQTDLVAADLAHGHALDGVTLTLGGINLVIAEIMHAHALDAVALTLDTYLAVADLLHAHTIDNVLVSIPGGTLDLILKILVNRQELNPATGTFTLYDNDGTTVLYTTSAWADAAGTVPYSGGALRRIDALF